MVNGKRKESAGDGGSPDGENNKPKATRYICLIRHSQYNLKGEGDKERVLTPLGTDPSAYIKMTIKGHQIDHLLVPVLSAGREQAELTGQRLAALGLKYDVLIHSSMTRATETANIISKHLPGTVHSRIKPFC